MSDTVTIARAELEQLIELVALIEDAVEYIDGHIEGNTYDCLETLNKIRGTLIVLL